jgi:hypothetical protein
MLKLSEVDSRRTELKRANKHGNLLSYERVEGDK